MGQHANFYKSNNGDRKYDADSFTEFIRPFFKTGIFNGECQVVSNQDMTVTAKTGNVNIGGKTKYFENDQTITVEAPHATLSRIDNVVIRRDDVGRDIYRFIQKGQFSTVPVAPTPIRNGGIYDLVCAQIYVGPSIVRILPENITDTRMNDSLCGWVASTIEEIDFNQINEQWIAYMAEFKRTNENAFNLWFETIKGKLSGDIAGSLQNQIDEANSQIESKANKSDIAKKEIVVTLVSANWKGTQVPYTYTLVGITEISSNRTIIDLKYVNQDEKQNDEYKRYKDALDEIGIEPVDELQTAGTVVFKAWASKPTIDIPIKLLIGGEVDAM